MRKIFLVFFCACVFLNTGIFVHASVSSGDLDVNTVSSGDIMVYTSYDTYYGSISSTYLEYMRGYLPKLSSNAHYVGARVGQYEYIFAYGEGLSYSGGVFSGSATVVKWRTDNMGSFLTVYDDNFELDASSYLVYTDLSKEYPTLATSSDFTLRQILILFTIFCICLTVNSMYRVDRVKRAWRGGRGD